MKKRNYISPTWQVCTLAHATSILNPSDPVLEKDNGVTYYNDGDNLDGLPLQGGADVDGDGNVVYDY